MSIELLKQHIEATTLSQSQVAAQLGKSPATINQYLQGKYKGDVESIDKAVVELVERQKSKSTDLSNAFIETPMAIRTMQSCMFAHVMNDLQLVIGEAGLGKTVALKEYAARNSNVVMLEVDPTFSSKVLLAEICNALGVTAGRNNHAMMTAVIEKLKGSDRLLIIDEAELLTLNSLEILRRIHDKAEVGIVLAGMPRLRANLRGARGQYKQIYSRVGNVHDLKMRLPAEDIAMFCESALGTAEFNETLNKVSQGNARRLNKLLRGINRMAVLNKAPVNKDMIDQFADRLID